MSYNLHNLRVVGLEVAEILYCTIQGKIGEHSSLVLGAYLKGGEEAVYGAPAYCPIEIEHDNGEEAEILFSGILSDICLEKNSGVDFVRIEGKSYSWLMDLTKRSRSFQDAQMSYQAMAETVMKDYPGSRLVFTEPETSIGRLIVQYEETDWAFLKRTMSSIGLTATPYDRQGGLNLYIGIPQLPERGLSYRLLAMAKDMELYYHLKANNRLVIAADLTRYQVRSHQLLQLFDTVRMSGQILTVSAYRLDFSSQEMEGDYWLQKAEGLSVAEQYPMHLIGVALMGKVVQAAGDKVLAALEIDRDQEGEPVHWFPYSTISASPDGSGWYCMPEIGDDIRIYFPSKDEEEAIALSAASAYAPSGSADRMQDPNSRYLRTRPGQELALTPKHLKLSCGDGLSSITMLTDGVILISAQKEIEVIGKEGVTLHAEQELGLHSQGLMEIESSSGGKIELNQQTATISGTEVKFDQ